MLITYVPGTPGLDVEELVRDSVVRSSTLAPEEERAEAEARGRFETEAVLDSRLLRFVALVTCRKDGNAIEFSPLIEMLQLSLPEPKAMVRPPLLSAGAQCLALLRGLTFVTIVNTARGETPSFLRFMGVRNGPSLFFLSIASLVVLAADLVASLLRRRAWRELGEATTQTLRNEVYSQILLQDMKVFDRMSRAELTRLIDRDTQHIGQLVARGGDSLVTRGVVLVVTVTSMFTAAPALLGFVAAIIPLLLLPGRLLSARTSAQQQKLAEAEIEFSRVIDNSLSNVIDIKSFSAEGREQARFFERSSDLASRAKTSYITSALQSRALEAILQLGWYVMASYSGNLAQKGKIDQAQYTWLLFLIPRLLDAPAELEEITRLYGQAEQGARSLSSILEIERQITSGPVPLAKESTRGEIVFERVSFAYVENHPVIQDVSFNLESGQTVAIVGPTGSGKTTLLRLLLRLYDVDQGSVWIDGNDVRELRLPDLRQAIGLVAQETYLFEGTIRENVQFGRPDATEGEIVRALELARARGFVERLPRGLDASVGERGRLLSGGERQRIALARTLLKAAPILALDEATSQLDYETEAAIQQSLRQEIAQTKRSALVVAHRLATIRHADQILVLEDGRITERGVHDELVAAGGLYKTLWELQLGAAPTDRSLLEVRIRPEG